ncbi:hypothetical protein QA860_11855 [Streptomyces stelliscabiei]|uniref:hypothetical protein n=1 Tax=Streptomyces TaxID=1883 RepID=UPI0006B32C36|nr:hypothetical protein [Streptomyces sp. NRRL B-24085]
MRLPTTTVLSLSALAVLTVASCSTSPAHSAHSPAGQDGTSVSAPAPLSSAALDKRLLDESDLGEDYTRVPQRPAAHDDVTVIGCPALEKLGGDTATGTSLAFPRKAKASFTYAGATGSELSEELYSDTAAKLSKGIGEIFDAMVSCPAYQVLSGSTAIDMRTQETAAPALGDEQWSQLLTFSAGGQRSIVKQTALRSGTVVVIVSGSPGLVDANLKKALDKAQSAR